MNEIRAALDECAHVRPAGERFFHQADREMQSDTRPCDNQMG
jgi:hypothetical protein